MKGTPVDADLAFGIMRKLLTGYYNGGGAQPIESLIRRGANFHDWILRHAVVQMLLRNEQFIAAYSGTQVGRVSSLNVISYSERIEGGATIVRMEFTARTGFETRFRLAAVLQNGRCGVRIDVARGTGPSFHGIVGGDGSVTDEQPAAPRTHSPARGHAVMHHHP